MSDTSKDEEQPAEDLDPFADDGTAILLQEDSEADALLIAFGGLFGSVAVPVYEFAKFASSLSAKGMFLRDPHRAWYFRGLPEAGDDLLSVEKVSPGTWSACSPVGCGRRCLGRRICSPSLRCATRLRRGARFFPRKTTVAKWQRFRLGDRRWKKDIRNIHSSPAENRVFEDLVPTLSSRRPGSTFHVHYCHTEGLDVAHAMRIASCEDVFLHAYAEATIRSFAG